MDNTKTDAQKIADEAVGQRPETAIPDAAKQSVTTPDQIGELAHSAGPEASVAALTAEALGERDDGAYAYRDASSDKVRARRLPSRYAVDQELRSASRHMSH